MVVTRSSAVDGAPVRNTGIFDSDIAQDSGLSAVMHEVLDRWGIVKTALCSSLTELALRPDLRTFFSHFAD